MADPAQTLEPSAARAQAVADHGLAILGELAELGLDMVRTLNRAVRASEDVQGAMAQDDPTCRLFPPFDFTEAANAYSRLTRAIRMTLMLRARIATPRTGPAASHPSTPHPVAPHPVGRRAVTKNPTEHLTREASEQLRDPDESAWLERPLREVLDHICHDLGLAPEVSASIRARWTAANAKAGATAPASDINSDVARPVSRAGDAANSSSSAWPSGPSALPCGP
jgi:hypothetical protein